MQRRGTNHRIRKPSQVIIAVVGWCRARVTDVGGSWRRKRLLRKVTWQMNLQIASNTVATGLLAFWILLTLTGFTKAWFAEPEVTGRSKDLQKRIEDLKRERISVHHLEARLDSLADSDVRDAMRREAFNMVCPGEKVARIK